MMKKPIHLYMEENEIAKLGRIAKENKLTKSKMNEKLIKEYK